MNRIAIDTDLHVPPLLTCNLDHSGCTRDRDRREREKEREKERKKERKKGRKEELDGR